MRYASNSEIKLLRKLTRKKYREKEQLFIVEGERAVRQVLDNDLIEVVSIFMNEEKSASFQPSSNSILLEKDIFGEIADTENPQGVLAMCRIPNEINSGELTKETGIIIATDAIQDPGNLGTIIRTAAWFGVKALLAGKGSVDVYHPKVVRSTAGATGSLPIISCELPDILPKLAESGWEILLLDGGADSKNLAQIKPSGKTILVVGNEANGVNEQLLTSFKKVKIASYTEPNFVESLNAGVALSIALFQFAEG